jgi:hypothetical protein
LNNTCYNSELCTAASDQSNVENPSLQNTRL